MSKAFPFIDSNERVSKPQTPRSSRGSARQAWASGMPPGTPKVQSRGSTPRASAAPEVDPKIVKLVWTSLKDRIYQRSHNLRHTFRELDANGTGLIPLPEFTEEMGRTYQLSPVERQCLYLMLLDADLKQDGKLDFREFCEMLKSYDKSKTNEMSARERKRFDRCVIDKKMQATVMRDDNKPIKLPGGLPTNELGSMNIDCPFGVLGDSEKMDAVVTSFLNVKTDKLRETFKEFDVNNNGRVSHDEFKRGMQTHDPYIFDDEIVGLLDALDPKKKGYVLVEEFVGGMGKEYLKKKAHRSQAHDSPFTWTAQLPGAFASIHCGQRGSRGSGKKECFNQGHVSTLNLLGGNQSGFSPHRHVGPPRTARTTKSYDLRAGENKIRVTDIYKREDGDFAARLNAGTTAAIPRPPPILGLPKRGATSHGGSAGGGIVGSSPRLPKIHR